MKAPLASVGLTLTLALTASAQQAGNSGPQQGQGSSAPRFSPTPGSGNSPLSGSMGPQFGSKRDSSVNRSDGPQEPKSMAELEAPKIPLPATIDQTLLLQMENGPFMVNAYSFVGPDAAKYAQLLVIELRHDYNLPAYIWYARIDPGRSMIQRVQPTANTYVKNGDLAPPESLREKDEAVVLVGNCKTQAEATELLKRVKPIKPVVLTKIDTIYTHRKGKGLFRATTTTNPFQATQNLYPGGAAVPGLPSKNGEKFDLDVATTAFDKTRAIDPMVRRMNAGGKHSLLKNPGAYTMVVAELNGRAAIRFANNNDFSANPKDLEKSPLRLAHDNAEKLADALSKCETLKGYKPYVFHDRTASYVTLGSFKSEKDPAAQALLKIIPQASNEMINRNLSPVMLLPADKLMLVPHDH